MFGTLLIALILLGVGAFAFQRLYRCLLSEQYQRSNLEREKKTIYEFLDLIGRRVTSGADVDETMDLIISFAQEATHADGAALFIMDPNGKTLRARVVKGMFPPLHTPSTDKLFAKRKFVEDMVLKEVIELGSGIIGMVAASGAPILVTDAGTDARLPKDARTADLRDMLVAPLAVRGEVLGVLALANKREEGPFSAVDQSLVSAFADQAAVTLDLVRLHKAMADKQRMEQELELARTFQTMLLPRETPDFPGYKIAGFYRSALEVGGDYFDYIDIDRRHLGIAIGDVSGKGIPGALVMASVRATLQAEARISLSPKAVLKAVNDRVIRDTKENVFITMTYGILDTVTGKFRFCRAGHEPIICCHDDGRALSTYLPEGIALGIIAGEMFNVTEEKEIDLHDEQTIVLYTDGIVEAMDTNAEEYGEKRFHNIIEANAAGGPQQIIEATIRDIDAYTKGRDQHDDITIVAVSWVGEEASSRGAADSGVATTA